jgi:hypothetical protein
MSAWVWVPGRLGVCMRVHACSLAYPACNAYAPYCDAICGLSGSTRIVNIISQVKKKLLNIKRIFWFSLQILSETFLILRRIPRDVAINVKMPSCKVPTILVRLLCNLNFLDRFSKKKKTQISVFIKISSVGVEFFHGDGQTNMTELRVVFRNFSNVHAKKETSWRLKVSVACWIHYECAFAVVWWLLAIESINATVANAASNLLCEYTGLQQVVQNTLSHFIYSTQVHVFFVIFCTLTLYKLLSYSQWTPRDATLFVALALTVVTFGFDSGDLPRRHDMKRLVFVTMFTSTEVTFTLQKLKGPHHYHRICCCNILLCWLYLVFSVS